MNNHGEELLNKATDAMKTAGPGSEELGAAARRVADRLGVAADASLYDASNDGAIQNCADVRQLLDAYRAGELSGARALFVDAHLRDCGECLRRFRSVSGSGAVDWAMPPVAREKAAATRRSFWQPARLGWTLAGSFATLATAVFLYKAYWEVPPGVRAEVESVEGSAYLVSEASGHPLLVGAALHDGERLRTAGGSRAVLRLSDGSTMEVNERSVLALGARGHSMTVSLDDGAVIVEAAKRTSGHLYVRTPDCRVAVTGTVFSVDAGIKGSRVGVLQGAVQVAHAGVDSTLQAGDQMSTSASLSPEPIEEQISWSRDRDKYVRLLAQFASLQHRIGQIPFPESRYSSDLLDRVPSDAMLYISVPNLGEFLNEANGIFRDQLSQSPELQQWWSNGHGNNTAALDLLVDRLHEVSQYLGDEVVIVGAHRANGQSGFAVIADVKRGGLDEVLRQPFGDGNTKAQLRVFDERSLATAQDESDESHQTHGGYALVRDHEAVLSNSVAMLKEMEARLNGGSSGFAASDFGKKIQAAYGRGAGIILAADLRRMMSSDAESTHGARREKMMQTSGLEDVQYLIAEHRETNGAPENHLDVEFAGARQRMASWLAAPAPIGSLDFVTPNASFAAAGLSKDPESIANDLVAMASDRHHNDSEDGDNAGKEIEATVRNEIVPNLGGDVLMALDGPVLPTPAWKLVIEVHDPERLEAGIEQVVRQIDAAGSGKDFHPVAIEPQTAGSLRVYAIRDQAAQSTVAFYTFADGFMIVSPDRAMLIDAIRVHQSGNTLARSTAFKALLPSGDHENCSAVAYQNLGPVLDPLLSQMSGESAAALRKLASDSKPTAVCVWGEENRIEAASDSRLFGFDFLELGSLLNLRNKSAHQHVTE